MFTHYQRPIGIILWHAGETTDYDSFVLPEQGVGPATFELARLLLAPSAGSRVVIGNDPTRSSWQKPSW